MKIRTDFVTNSSSSSFIIAHKLENILDDIIELANKKYLDIDYNILTQEKCDWLDNSKKEDISRYYNQGFKIETIEFPDGHEELIKLLHDLENDISDYHIIEEYQG